ncbi:MAG: TRM11 family methyltransferase [Clostridiaceae bacterium]
MKDSYYLSLIEKLTTSDDKQRLEIINTFSNDYNNAFPLLWSTALRGDNIRGVLGVIRDMIKKEKAKGIFKRTLGNSKDKLSGFLENSDAKTRKNACAIIAELGDSYYLDALYNGYQAENQCFVRPSYVNAISNCGRASDGEKLQNTLDALITNKHFSDDDFSEDKKSLSKNEKHLNEEKIALKRAIAKLSPNAFHDFKNFENPVPMILTAMDDNFQITLNDLKEKSIKATLTAEGVLINEKDLNKIYSCRTFYEVIFPLDGCKNLEFSSKSIASAIIKSNIVDFLNSCHINPNNTPYYYRIEYKTTNFNDEKTEFVKNISKELDTLSNDSMRNSPSSYEVEIRIVETKKSCSAFVKLYSFKDYRFDYRYKSLPSSINPVSAAIVMKSISKWLNPVAKIIDPFCGTGTMLIERSKVKSYKTLTGVDIYRTAIEDAIINTKLAKLKIDLIADDILEYNTSELFDEMISNMPFESKTSAHNLSFDLYNDFINKIPMLVKPGGMVFLYTVEKNLFRENLIDKNHLQLIDEIKIVTGGLTPHIFVLKVK